MTGSPALVKAIWRSTLLCVGLLWIVAANSAFAGPDRNHARSGTAAHAAKSGKARATPAVASARRSPARRPVARHNAPKPHDNRPLIVVDAGHGGRDAGAVGANGTLEKDITLAAALELSRQLRATRRYRVAMTRSDDRSVSLPARLALSRGAAIFVSIHADASPNRQARGASVYVRPISSRRFRSSGPVVLAHAARLQHAMIETLDDDVRMTKAPARQARLHVLGHPAVPSVLIEIGFLSNRHDEALLGRANHRATVAAAIREAIDTHFDGESPDATRG